MKSRHLLPLALGAVWAITQSGCVGGQTGQPTSGTCTEQDVSGTDAWNGSTVALAARAFLGEHRATLSWFAGPPQDDSAPVALDDSMLIKVSIGSGTVSESSCSMQLHVPVVLELATSASGFSERAETELEIVPTGKPLRATFHIETATLRVDGELVEVQSGLPPRVTLVPSGSGAPGGWARAE